MKASRVFGFVGVFASVAAISTASPAAAADKVKIGLNYPRTGPYFTQGLDQLRAANIAVEEINEAGGILGKKIELVLRDSKSQAPLTQANVRELIDQEGAKMVFGGSSSGVAIAAADVCQEKGVLFFGTLTYSNDTTGKDGHRHTFRECYNAWMGAKVLANYMERNFSGKRYFYVTADYTWGWTTEASFRKFTKTEDKQKYPGVKTPFPKATPKDFKRAMEAAKKANPDVLVLVLFGQDMANAVNIAAAWGMKDKMQIVVPNLTLGMAESSGAHNMAGIVGALPWTWKVPFKYGYPKGKQFVEKFAKRHKRYPSTSGASAYTILHQYKAAVERVGSFDSAKVIATLEDHRYSSLKDEQQWRGFDHQSVQTVYAVRCNPPEVVNADKFKLDYFEIIDSMPGAQAVQSRQEWEQRRQAAGKSSYLERFPGEQPPAAQPQ